MFSGRLLLTLLLLTFASALTIFSMACGGNEVVVETVIVEKEVEVERVVEKVTEKEVPVM